MSAVVEFPVAPEVQPYLDAFRTPAGEPLWLVGQRRRSLARFAADGFPSRRGEAWRYLDLRGLAAEPLLPAGAGGAATNCDVPDEIGFSNTAHRLVLVDGRFAPELSAARRSARRGLARRHGDGDRGAAGAGARGVGYPRAG